MNSTERREMIVTFARNFGGYASVRDLADLTGVTPLTIRRDAEELEEAGLVRRSRGAIQLVEQPGVTLEPSFLSRTSANALAKRSIASAAAARVRPHTTIGIDTGTTTLMFSQLLTAVSGLTVVTSSLVVATQTAQSHEVHVLAGRVRPGELSLVGPQAYASALDVRLDQVFLGAAGVSHQVYDYSIEDAYTKRALIANADEVVLLCDSSKFGVTASALVCDLADVSTLVTEAAPSDDFAHHVAGASVEVVVSDSRSSPSPDKENLS
jgi:DeoR family fructose operon transcriptional repressor